MDEALTFSELRKVQKEEEREENLTELGDGFMLQAADYFRQKQELGDDREYRNAERVFEKILSLREDKIVRSAKIAANSERGAPDNLMPFENELFRDLKDAFRSHRERADEKKESQAGTTQEDTQPEPEPENTEEDVDERNGDGAAEGYKIIETKSEVPEFMGTDLESYGPFDEGERVEVPEDNAEILSNRGSAEVVE